MVICFRDSYQEFPLPSGVCAYCKEPFFVTQSLFAKVDEVTFAESDWAHADCGVLEGTDQIRDDVIYAMDLTVRLRNGEL